MKIIPEIGTDLANLKTLRFSVHGSVSAQEITNPPEKEKTVLLQKEILTLERV